MISFAIKQILLLASDNHNVLRIVIHPIKYTAVLLWNYVCALGYLGLDFKAKTGTVSLIRMITSPAVFVSQAIQVLDS